MLISADAMLSVHRAMLESVSVAAPIHACYYTNWAIYRPEPYKFAPQKVPIGMCTHILYAFAAINISSYKAKLTDEWSDEGLNNMAGINGLKDQQPGLKTLLSFGGWTESQTGIYNTVASDPEKRATFIASAWNLANSHGFDGIDIDWEYPGANDRSNFVALIKELKAAAGGKLVTAAVTPNSEFIDAGYDVPGFEPYMDLLFVMTYDFHGGWENTIGHVAAYSEATAAMECWAAKGFPRAKIIMGIAAYGRGWRAGACVKGGATSGLAPAGSFTQEAGIASYFELTSFGGTSIDTPEGPYLEAIINGGKVCYGYDDRNSVIKKMNFIKRRGFGGAFSWTIDYDAVDFTVHKAIVDGLGGVLPPPAQDTTAHPIMVTTTTKQTSTAQPPSGTCTDGEMRANADRSFYEQCVHGTWIVRPCAPGTVFYPSINACGWP